MQERVGRERSPRASKLPRAITEERRSGRTSADVACGEVARSPDAEWRASTGGCGACAHPCRDGARYARKAHQDCGGGQQPLPAPPPRAEAPTLAWNPSWATGTPDRAEASLAEASLIEGLFNRGCFACAIRPAPRSRAAPAAQPTCRVGSPARESPLRGSGAAASIAANPLGCPSGLRGVTLTHRT